MAPGCCNIAISLIDQQSKRVIVLAVEPRCATILICTKLRDAHAHTTLVTQFLSQATTPTGWLLLEC